MKILWRRDRETGNLAGRERPSAATQIGACRKLRSGGHTRDRQAERLAPVTIDQVDRDVEGDGRVFITTGRSRYEIDTLGRVIDIGDADRERLLVTWSLLLFAVCWTAAPALSVTSTVISWLVCDS